MCVYAGEVLLKHGVRNYMCARCALILALL